MRIITLRGINENKQANMLANFTSQFGADVVVEEFYDWHAQFATPNETYEELRVRVSGSIRQYLRTLDEDEIILAGYSAGAHIIGDLLNQLSFHERVKIKHVVLCADPARPVAFDLGSYLYGSTRPFAYGIAGSRQVKSWGGSPVAFVSYMYDPICSLPQNSGLRELSETLITLSPDVIKSSRLRTERIRAGLVKPFRYSFGSIMQAFGEFGRYAFGGDHVNPYPDMLRNLARELR